MSEFDSSVEYRDVPGFPGYKVGNDGSVWSCYSYDHCNGQTFLPRYRQLKLNRAKSGRLRITLYRDNRRYYFQVSRLILTVFVGACPHGMEACHFPDRSPANNTLVNLRWDTPANNSADAAIHGTQVRGERCPAARLTADNVRAIRSTYIPYVVTVLQLATQYGVSTTTIEKIISRRGWKHVA